MAMTPAEKAKLKKELKPLKEGSRSKSGGSTLSAVAKRFGITAREARDIATAVGSAATAIRKSPQEGMPVKKIVKNVAKQVKEVGTAATSGKKVARDADSVNISDYKVQGTRTAIRGRMAVDRAKTAGRAKNVEMKLKKAAAKKVK